MSISVRLLGYVLHDVARSRWILATAAFFLLATDALLRFGTGGAASVLAIGSLVLLVVPLVSILFGTIYLHHAREFTALLLAHPVTRRQLFVAQITGMALPMTLAIMTGVALPFAVHGLPQGATAESLGTVLGLAGALAFVFLALAAMVAVWFEDRVTGLATAVGLWLLFTVIHDGAVLLVILIFSDYPLEPTVLGLMVANPVDLARVLLLVQFDASALMGYTGAVLQRTLTGSSGTLLAIGALAAWVAVPSLWAWHLFRRKDL
jgi:Cu-processing system permease protein